MKNHPDILKAIDAFMKHIESMTSEEFKQALEKQKDGPFTQMYKDGFRPCFLGENDED